MISTLYGYVRVSAKDQNEDRQLLAMREFGVAQRHIYTDKQSGRDFDRPQYLKLLHRLRPGDVLVVKSIDRLGRSYHDILAQWQELTKVRSIAIVVLDMPLLDTRQRKDLMGTVIADIVLQLLSYVAQTEREMIHQRQAEGIAAAMNRGVRFGRTPAKRPEGYNECLRQWKMGELSAREAGKQLGVAHTTFLTWARKEEATEK